MKKTTFVLLMALLLFNTLTSRAQIENYYTFSQGTQEYTPLVGADESILTPYTYDNVFIPFDFEFAGKIISHFFTSSSFGGVLYTGGTSLPQPNNLSTLGQQNRGTTSIIAPLWDVFSVPSDNTTAKRKTLLQGTAPNRTYTIEWENILWSNTGSEVSLRVILEETTNNITFLYGPNMSEEIQTASIGINTEFADSLSFLSVTPNNGSATISSTEANNSISSSEYPGEGTTYAFTYNPPSCKIPSNVYVFNNTLTPSTAELRWTAGGEETEWDIIVTDENQDTSTIINTNTNPYVIENLNEDTFYGVTIRSKCGTDTNSEYSSKIFFTSPQICPQPTNLVTDTISYNNASFTWNAGDAETEWEIIVLESSEPAPDSGTVVTSTNYEVSDLIKDTDYTAYVRGNCGSEDGYSKWTTRTFRTLATCNAPTNVIISNEQCSSFDLSWTSDNAGNLWEVLLEKVGNDEQTIIQADTNTITVENLNANSLYRVYVKSICDIDDESRYSVRDFARTIIDSENPMALTKNIVVELNESGNASITANDIDNGSSDNCEIQSLSVSPDVFDCSNIGENTVWLTVTDAAFRTTYASATVTILDNIMPTAITVDSLTVQLDSNGSAIINTSDIDNGSSDNCSVQTITIDKTEFTTDNVGENIVTLTVTDNSGNNATTSTTVYIEDALPVASCIEPFSIQLNESGNASISINNIDTGSINGDVSIDKTEFTTDDIGENTITLTVTNTSGNTATCTTVITILEATPVANCIEPFSIQLNESGNASISINNIDTGSVNGNVSIDKTEFTSNDIGENTVTLTVTNTSGNTATCTTVVTILEATPTTTFVLEDYLTGLTTPRGLAFDNEDILYVGDQSGKIYKVTDVETSTEFANTGFSANNIIFDNSGKLYTTDDFFSQIFQVNTNGEHSVYLNFNNNVSDPWGITFDTEGNLYYSNQFGGKIIKVTPELTSTDYATGMFSPEGIAFDSNGNLFVADRSDRKLIKVEPNGTTTTLLSNLRSVRAVTVDSDDNVYFNYTVGTFNAESKIIKYNKSDESQTEIYSEPLDFSSQVAVNELAFNSQGDLFIAKSDRVSVIRGVASSQTLSNEQNNYLTNFKFYPNPVDNILYFDENIDDIIIYNTTGKKLLEYNSGYQFDLSSLPSGMYLIKINKDNTSSIEKIIKK